MTGIMDELSRLLESRSVERSSDADTVLRSEWQEQRGIGIKRAQAELRQLVAQGELVPDMVYRVDLFGNRRRMQGYRRAR